MVTLEVTRQQAEELIFATSLLYQEYQDDMGADYNEAIRRYNDRVDDLRISIKQQLKDQ